MAGSRNIIGIKNPAIDKLIERADLRQGSRRPGRRDQGARPRAAVESLCRAAVELPQGPHRALGSLWPAVRIAEIRPVGLPVAVVVRRRQGGAERQTVLKDILRMAQFSRRHVLGLGVGALAAARLRSGAGGQWRQEAAWPFGVRRTEISRRFPPFRLRQCRMRRRAECFRNSSARAARPSIRSTPTSSRAIGASGMDLTFASLMARAFDEPDAVYLLAAEELTRLAGRAGLSASGCGRASTSTTAARSPRPTSRSR